MTHPDLERRFGGLRRLYGEEAYATLRHLSVAVVGLGGVGSWTVEALARSGVHSLVLIDFDHVEVIRGSGKTMPRALLHDKHGNAYLEGTDGSTERSYFMSVDPAATTCRQAHQSICGLDESLCVAQS